MGKYDLIVIGAGPGGYVAAVEAAELGKKVAVIERQKIGGTCLNVGCIPSKAYLKHASWMEELKEANRFGLVNTLDFVDYGKLVDRKNQVVTQLQQGIHYLFKHHKIDYFEGEASLKSRYEVQVNDKILTTDYMLLATGSRPFVPPIKGLETTDYLTTETFFDLQTLPKELVIIGGGVIGIELAFAMAPLGSQVTVIEAAPNILMTEDNQARDIIKKQLKKMGVMIYEGVEIKEVQAHQVILAQEKVSFDKLLVVTGRQANLELAGQLGLRLTNQKKFIDVNEYYQTNSPNVYAVGDIIEGYMLAHAASKEGVKAVRHMFGDKELPLSNDAVPRCVYTHPEIASFGMTAEEAEMSGQEVLIASVPYSANGRAIAGNETLGFIKIIADKKYREILGAVIVGANATEMIHTLLAIKQAEGTVFELEQMTFAHPTLSEMMGELANQMID
ncbi:dihydrolipoyl dehydrogenase [Vagococcus elongatus]|uniref:dihydrolipoyl dehydrogenase n=1 Tax=Vagococcus elongatus TaxID=180344 RepID=UPI001B8728D7|nr:dihydrolipoyl dehydrogenase [Vagococcus elongatus]